jgi:hypothetical protein
MLNPNRYHVVVSFIWPRDKDKKWSTLRNLSSPPLGTMIAEPVHGASVVTTCFQAATARDAEKVCDWLKELEVRIGNNHTRIVSLVITRRLI